MDIQYNMVYIHLSLTLFLSQFEQPNIVIQDKQIFRYTYIYDVEYVNKLIAFENN